MKQKYQDFNIKHNNFSKISMIFLAILLTITLVYNYNNLKLGMRIKNYGQIIASYKTIKEEQGIENLTNINKNFWGWITCDKANISLPIVNTTSEKEEEFYLDHDFEGYKNPLGVPYKKSNCNIETTTNTVIVGHSSYNVHWFGDKSYQTIFANLRVYLSNTENLNITLETLNNTYQFKIISAFSFDSKNYNDDDIIAYTTTNITTQAQFNNFYNNIKEQSAVDTGINAQFGDKFLTLYTCDSANLRYRIVVVAKLVN